MKVEKLSDANGDYTLCTSASLSADPIISVIISVLNGEKNIKDSVESILSQTYKKWELILINDGSADNTEQILKEYVEQDSRIIVISQRNIGLTRSLNRGIAHARGQFIARQDCDDISFPNRLEHQLQVIEDQAVDVLGCGCEELINNSVTREVKIKVGNLRVGDFYQKNQLVHSGILVRKTPLFRYNEKYRYSQDLEFYLRAGDKLCIYNDDMVLIRRQNTRGMISDIHKIAQLWCGVRARYAYLLKHLNIQTLYYTFFNTLKFFYAAVFSRHSRLCAQIKQCNT